jgi:hypothetical protein
MNASKEQPNTASNGRRPAMTKTFKSITLAMAASGLIATAVPAAAIESTTLHTAASAAQLPTAQHSRGYDEGYRGDDNRGYDNRPYYGERRYYNQANAQTWRGDDGRTYCRKPNGTTGLLIGGVLGGVLGHEIAGRRGDRTLGVILGAAGGALAGRAIDRSGSRCR